MNCQIITFNWSNNLGALIQSISLQHYIEKELKFKTNFNTFIPQDLIAAERKSQINKKNLRYIFSLIDQKIKLYYWKKKVAKFHPPEKKILFNNFNVTVYGSDEIWNFSNKIFNFNMHFFGEQNQNKKIAYACSIGSSKFDNINKKLYLEIKKNLKEFESISVRDKNTYNFIKNILGKKTEIVLDPCFLITPKIIDGTGSKLEEKFNFEKFILIYGNYFNKVEVNEILNLKKKNNFKIISVYFINQWSDQNLLNINPNDFIFLIKKSQFIFTSMFHGIMLSYKYKKEFWFTEDPYKKYKMNYFISYLNLQKRKIEFISNDKINYNDHQSKINDWIDLSKNYLTKNIK